MEKTYYPDNIKLFFIEVVKLIQQDLNPEFIIIAGGFSKKSWLFLDNSLISDFEFVFISKKRWSIKRKNVLLKKMNKNFPYEISLKGYLLDKVEKKL